MINTSVQIVKSNQIQFLQTSLISFLKSLISLDEFLFITKSQFLNIISLFLVGMFLIACVAKPFRVQSTLSSGEQCEQLFKKRTNAERVYPAKRFKRNNSHQHVAINARKVNVHDQQPAIGSDTLSPGAFADQAFNNEVVTNSIYDNGESTSIIISEVFSNQAAIPDQKQNELALSMEVPGTTAAGDKLMVSELDHVKYSRINGQAFQAYKMVKPELLNRAKDHASEPVKESPKRSTLLKIFLTIVAFISFIILLYLLLLLGLFVPDGIAIIYVVGGVAGSIFLLVKAIRWIFGIKKKTKVRQVAMN